MLQAQSALGLVVLLFLAWALGEERRLSAWRIAVTGAVLQLVLAASMLYLPALTDAVAAANRLVAMLDAATKAGTSLVFGYLGGGPLPFEEGFPGASFVLAFRALPVILVVSALAALLTHWRILPLVIRGFGRLLERSFRVGGPVGLVSAANVLVGMIEAPLLVRPYLSLLSRSELFVLMATGMATIAGTVYVLYSLILTPVLPDAASQLLVASVISAPAAVTVALLMVPPREPPTEGRAEIPRESTGAMDAVVHGTGQGVKVLIAVVAMLIVFVALVHLANAGLGMLPDLAGTPLTLQRVLSWPLVPIAWLLGIPWEEARTASQLLATKVVLNELVAYLDLAKLPEEALSARSRLIVVYALCGFANLGSLGIMIGGLSTLVPERRAEVVALGPKSIVAGFLATCLTGAVAGVLTPAS